MSFSPTLGVSLLLCFIFIVAMFWMRVFRDDVDKEEIEIVVFVTR